MIPRPADFHEQTWGQNTWPFLMAVLEGDERTVREMLLREPWLARAEYAYLQPLHYAVKGGRVEMVRLLLAAGANPLAEGWSGRPLGDDTPLARARDREQPNSRKSCNSWKQPPPSRSRGCHHALNHRQIRAARSR